MHGVCSQADTNHITCCCACSLDSVINCRLVTPPLVVAAGTRIGHQHQHSCTTIASCMLRTRLPAHPPCKAAVRVSTLTPVYRRAGRPSTSTVAQPEKQPCWSRPLGVGSSATGRCSQLIRSLDLAWPHTRPHCKENTCQNLQDECFKACLRHCMDTVWSPYLPVRAVGHVLVEQVVGAIVQQRSCIYSGTHISWGMTCTPGCCICTVLLVAIFCQQRVAQGMQAHVMPTSSICHSMRQQTAGQLFNNWVEPHIPLGSVSRWVQHKWGGTDRTVSVVG